MVKAKKEIKKSNWKIPLIIGIFAVVIIYIIVFKISFGQTKISNPKLSPICRDVQVPYDYEEVYWETVPYTAQECETKNLAYSVENFIIRSNTCNEKKKECKSGFIGIPYDCIEYCIDKTISCSLDLKNLDNEEQESWTIRFNFYDRDSRTTIDTKDATLFLYPQTQKTFIGTTRITSGGVEGNANKDLTCGYVESYVPTKQICRDVTKYQEIQKTITITRYKTEQKCD